MKQDKFADEKLEAAIRYILLPRFTLAAAFDQSEAQKLQQRVDAIKALIAQRETAARIDEITKILNNAGGTMLHVEPIQHRLAELTQTNQGDRTR